MEKKLYRSRDKVISGVAGGIANYFEVDPTLIRLLWVIVALMGGTGVIAYIICAVVIPENPRCTINGGDEEYVVESKHKYNSNGEDYYIPEEHEKTSTERNRMLAGGILIALGAVFLAKRYVYWFNFDIIWPLLLIGGGAYIIYKQRGE